MLKWGQNMFECIGGIYMASTAEIAQIRSYMAKHAKTLAKLSSAAEFKKWYGEVRGEKSQKNAKRFGCSSGNGTPNFLTSNGIIFIKCLRKKQQTLN